MSVAAHPIFRRLWRNAVGFVVAAIGMSAALRGEAAEAQPVAVSILAGFLGVILLESITSPEARLSTARAVMAGVAAVLLLATLLALFAGFASWMMQKGALDRARQKKTMADMATIASCISRYRADHKALPESIQAQCMEVELPNVHCFADGWNACFLAIVRDDSVALISRGKGSKLDPVDPFVSRGATYGFQDDLVMVDGQWITYPEGVDRALPPNNALQRTRFARR